MANYEMAVKGDSNSHIGTNTVRINGDANWQKVSGTYSTIQNWGAANGDTK